MCLLFRKFYKMLFISSFILFLVFSFSVYSAENFSFRVNHGFLSGEANELVYKDSQGTKLSQLIWGLEGVKLLGVGVTYGGDSIYKINTDFYINYLKSTSQMDDYDWINNTEWTHWSNSPTDINGVYKFDINVEYDLFINDFSLFFLGGYKVDMFKWVGSGGTYIYSSDDGSNFRAYSGTFANEPLISYNQYFYFPYIGVGGKYFGDKLGFEGKINYSNSVLAKDEDTHHQRENGGIFFQGYFEDGQVLETKMELTYNLSSNFRANFSYLYTKYFLNKGEYTGTYMGTGGTFSGGYGSVGLENYSKMFVLGLNYSF